MRLGLFLNLTCNMGKNMQQSFKKNEYMRHRAPIHAPPTSGSSCPAWFSLCWAWWAVTALVCSRLGQLHSFFMAAIHMRCWALSPPAPADVRQDRTARDDRRRRYSCNWRPEGRQNSTTSTVRDEGNVITFLFFCTSNYRISIRLSELNKKNTRS